MGKKSKKKKQDQHSIERIGGSWKWAVLMTIAWIVWVAIWYYICLPAVNIHSYGMWGFIIFLMLLPAGALRLLYVSGVQKISVISQTSMGDKPTGFLFGIALVLFVLVLGASIYGSTMFHAGRYSEILNVEDYDFTKDIDSNTATEKIALMDTDSAILLGNREIGSLSQLVSQYDVSEDYSQIDYGGYPSKISALKYAGFFKYLGNKDHGVPGYVQVDPVKQSAQYVALEQGMKYVPSSYFQKDLRRHLRFQYPTLIFENIHFEIDENGKPYYVAAVSDFKIGLFGGNTVKAAVVCDPVTGESTCYTLDEIPKWVDNVFDGDLLVSQYNWKGLLSNGFFNSIFGKKGCRHCTETVNTSDSDDEDDSYVPDYGYVAKDGDIWIYTGVTSVNEDSSNIGFILVNERTSEAHYYTVAGADENSAMSAAEGEVQEKGYQASFPSLINVAGQPTYVMVLKDASGIVKLYATVNVESYNIVTTSDSLEDCLTKYKKRIGADDSEEDTDEKPAEQPQGDSVENTFAIASIQYVTIDGSTYVYLEGKDGNIYRQKFADNEDLIYLRKGNEIKVTCVQEKDKHYLIQGNVTILTK
ncbi:MAG: hypothetical protein MRZ36_07925 [Eubacterium sp.]|nr:hypothetical protein [Eubacterium sp.]